MVVIVSSDREGREVWGIPGQFHEAGCENFRFVCRGVAFRVALGRTIDPIVQDACCVRTGLLFYGGVQLVLTDRAANILVSAFTLSQLNTSGRMDEPAATSRATVS